MVYKNLLHSLKMTAKVQIPQNLCKVHALVKFMRLQRKNISWKMNLI